ncbi:hypothetical protein ACFE04_010130 [Oxalis oulophora]
MPRKANYGVDYEDDDGYDDVDYDYDYYEHDVEVHGEEAPVSTTAREIGRKDLWSCPICTYDNDNSMSACDICGVIRNPLPSKNNTKADDGICKKSGISIMAKSLFASLPHQTRKKALLHNLQSDGCVTEGGNNIPMLGNIQDYLHELPEPLSSCRRPPINIAPFKFDAPSPDDLVSSGISSSNLGSKSNFSIPKPQSDKKSGPGSSSAPKSRVDNVDESKILSGGRNPGDVANDLNDAALAVKSEIPRNSKPSKSNSQTHYKPEQWMLPSSDAMTQLNLAIVGHVDSGKSTLSGRLLHLLGRISQKQMHKYQKDAKSQGKGSFAYAWALDESAEERERGITMTVAIAFFDTKKYHVVILDSPGHKDFVPNMISGATQADAAILVIDASVGSFEAGLDSSKGQTKEHAQLIRSFGVDQIIVVVNKMDVVEYSKDRFDLIKNQLGTFLRSVNFKDSSVLWIPVSAMENQNLAASPSDERLSSWYRGPYLLDAIDSLQPPTRDFSKPLMMPICDVIKSSTAQGGISAVGKLEAGALRSGVKVLVMPSGEVGTVRSLERDSQTCTVARAGDNVNVTLQGVDATQVSAGGVLCHPDFPIAFARHLELKVVILDVQVPILIGSQLEFHVHHAKEAASVVRLVSLLDSKTGKPGKKNPRILTSKQSAVIEVRLEEPVCVVEFSKCKGLGRVSLRCLGKTVAAGIVTKIIDEQE